MRDIVSILASWGEKAYESRRETVLSLYNINDRSYNEAARPFILDMKVKSAPKAAH
jgi:hypothetical protein